MSFASVKSGATISSNRNEGAGIGDRFGPDLPDVYHKSSPVPLPGCVFASIRADSGSCSRSSRSLDSDRTSRYQLAEVTPKQRSDSVYSNPEEMEQEVSTMAQVNAPDIFEREAASTMKGEHWEVMDAKVPLLTLDSWCVLGMALVSALSLGVCIGIIVWLRGVDSLHWDFYALVAVAVFIAAHHMVVATLQVRRLLRTLAVQLAPLVVPRHADDGLLDISDDPRVAYLQVALQNARLLGGPAAEENIDSLAFMHSLLKDFDVSANGFVIIDASGTILYCNDPLCQYFGYNRPDLIGENVRLLMPAPYNRQHDQLLRRHSPAGLHRGTHNDRPAPVVDVNGKLSVVKLRVTEHADPHDPETLVFIGRMKFHEVGKTAQALKERLQSGFHGIELACQCFDMYHDYILVMDSRGIIEFINFPLAQLLGQCTDDLKGRNVASLLTASLKSLPEDFLSRFLNKPETRSATQQWYEVGLRGKGDVEIKAYMHLAAIQCNGQLDGFVVLCNLVLRPEIKHRSVDFGEHRMSVLSTPTSSPNSSNFSIGSNGTRRRFGTRSNRSQASSKGSRHASGYLSRLHLGVKKCTVVMIDVFGLQQGVKVASAEYDAFLTLLTQSCARHKAHLHAVLGDRVVVTLNAALANNSHRSSAGALVAHVTMTWNSAASHGSMKMLAVAVTQEVACGTFGQHAVVVSEALDVCSAMLRVAAECRVANVLIDAALHEELQYLYECRLVNFITFHPKDKRIVVRPIYEIHALKSMTSEEWMYQVTQEIERPRLVHWQDCWSHLVGSKNTLGFIQPNPTPNFAAALECIAAHLAEHPSDIAATWLQLALKRKCSSPGADAGMTLEVAGKLQFFMHYRLPDRPSSISNISPKPRSEEAAAFRPRRTHVEGPAPLADVAPPERSSSGPKHRLRELPRERTAHWGPGDSRLERPASECSVVSDPG